MATGLLDCYHRPVSPAAMWKKYNSHSGIYHTTSPVENFEFVVTLRNISSFIQLPKFDGDNFTHSLPASDESYEEIRIKWQEKIFSPQEIEAYSNVENCLNDVQKEYNNLILHCDNIRDGKVFTYVDGDNFSPSQSIVRYSANSESQTVIPWQRPLRRPDEEQQQEMFVYASLNPDIMLFHVRWKPKEATFIIFPDFTGSDVDPYYFEIDSDYRRLYSYTVRNTSQSVEKSNASTDSVCRSVFPAVAEEDGAFRMPPLVAARISILIDIKSASDFARDNLHVRYRVLVPDEYFLEEGKVVGSTHSSIPKNSRWNFGHCFQLTIFTQRKMNLEDKLIIHLEVISVDNWSCERCEGFTQTTLVLGPGRHIHNLPCYVIDYGLLDRITRYFIGGKRPFDEEQLNLSRQDFQSKYQQKTISTGNLRLESQVLVQSNVSALGGAELSRVKLDQLLKKHTESRERMKTIVTKK